jgi:hypothetical protein
MSDLAELRIWDDPAIRGALSWYLDVAENRRPVLAARHRNGERLARAVVLSSIAVRLGAVDHDMVLALVIGPNLLLLLPALPPHKLGSST